MTENDPKRRPLDELIAEALYGVAVATLEGLAAAGESLEMRAAVRDELARDVEHIFANSDPRRPGARLRYGWCWDHGARRERERARSLGVVVHVLRRDGGDECELGRWRVRELCAGDGTPADTVETLRWLTAQFDMGPVPDDLTALYAQGHDAETLTALRLTVVALTRPAGEPLLCCNPAGPPEGMEPTRAHLFAHEYVAAVQPAQREVVRARLLAEYHAARRAAGRAA